MPDAFWENSDLNKLTDAEWESLCDNCGRCCLIRLEDADDGEIYTTNIVCREYDQKNGRCGCYETREEKVPGCIKLTPQNILEETWIPITCAYRRLAEGRNLAFWHPLVGGEEQKSAQEDMSIIGKVVSERDVKVEDYEDYVIYWADMEPV